MDGSWCACDYAVAAWTDTSILVPASSAQALIYRGVTCGTLPAKQHAPFRKARLGIHPRFGLLRLSPRARCALLGAFVWCSECPHPFPRE